MYRNAIRALKLNRDPHFASMLEQPRIFGPAARTRARLAVLVWYGMINPVRRLRR
jgi:hypothetical protein